MENRIPERINQPKGRTFCTGVPNAKLNKMASKLFAQLNLQSLQQNKRYSLYMCVSELLWPWGGNKAHDSARQDTTWTLVIRTHIDTHAQMVRHIPFVTQSLYRRRHVSCMTTRLNDVRSLPSTSPNPLTQTHTCTVISKNILTTYIFLTCALTITILLTNLKYKPALN